MGVFYLFIIWAYLRYSKGEMEESIYRFLDRVCILAYNDSVVTGLELKRCTVRYDY